MMNASATMVGLCLLVSAASGFMDCPRHCTCTQSSFMGGQARCTFLDPGTQQFPPDISSLVVVNYPEERLPARFFTALGLSGIMTLSMTNGSIAHISKDAFAGLDFLEDLDLSFNRIQKLDPLTFQNSRLKRLSLNGNPLTLYDTSAKDKRFLISESIIELTITDGKISTSDDLRALSGMPNLEFVDLSGNQIRELKDDVFSTLINLEEINLSNNVISHIDRDTFADIEDLTSLNLRGNPLKSLEGIEIPGLKDLDVSNCNFEMLTASTLEGFPELSSLNLSQNSILTIDMDTFMSVPGLRDLDLSYNRLRGPISDLLFEFNKKLETVSFRGNSDIKYLPGFKGNFLHLYNYDISACGLTNISNDTFKGMSALVSLNASNNALVHLEPKTFSELPNLVVLDLSNNNLHALNGKLFTGNRELSKLYLSKNYFRHLTPLLFQSTPKLHHLDLSNCRLTSLWNISESFTMRNRNILSKLIYLNVSGNRLTKLHTHYFISLESLQKLDISNNPIECTSDFSHVMEWLIVKKVLPNKKTEHAERMDLIESNVQWDEVLRSVCPDDLPRYNTVRDDMPMYSPVSPQSISSEKGIEIPIMEETPLVWPMALVWASIFSIVFALANIIGLLIYRSRRNYTVLGYKSQMNSALDGHFPVCRSGRPMYQKLYEECSVPAPIHSGNNKLHIVAILGNKLNKNNSDV